MHLEHGNYFADILQASGTEPFWYYIIQRKDSNHITDLVKFSSHELAVEAARQALAHFNQAAAAD